MPASDSGQIIVTAQEAAGVIALDEIQKQDAGARLVKRLDATAQLVRLTGGFSALSGAWTQHPPVFVRHLFPVQLSLPLQEWRAEGPQSLPLPLAALLDELEAALPASVQMRCSAEGAARDFAAGAAHAVMDGIGTRGLPYSKKAPEQILSLYFDTNTVYAGVSSPRENLSAYNGGQRMFRREDGMLSRAEFKLLEALEVFPAVVPYGGHALDLGAAPGGWTRVLLNRGMQVTAVDPARLDPALENDPRVVHFGDVSQKYRGQPESTDLLVNDMRMEPGESARILLEMRPLLKREGQALLTLKLAKKQWYKQTMKAVELLGRGYEVAGIRQLFNNRSEVTVFLKNRA
ncbi:MAG: hypothetical protein HFJ80_04735 [Clostridiales bacterium]|nr:hypothetical protein [Clostridiales bacterium]